MVRRLAAALPAEGVEAHVATTNDDGVGTKRVPFGVPVREHGATYWYFPRQARFYTASWPLATWLRQHVAEYDVVHVHGLFSWAAIPAAFWSRRRNVPFVVRPLGTLNRWGMQNRRPGLKKWSLRLVESRILANAAAVHYTSEQEQREAESLGVRTAMPAIIPNPVAVPDAAPTGEFCRKHPQLIGHPLVLFLSRVDEKKGLNLLLSAFSRVLLTVPDAKLVIAGDGPADFVARMKQQSVTLALEGAVLWAGFVAGADKDALLADADLFVLPSYSENFGIAVAEAMAAGLPVVVSDQVAIHTDVTVAGAGLVTKCDADALGHAITHLLMNPERRAAMGRAGAACAERKYSPSSVAKQVVRLYEDIVSSRARPLAAQSGVAVRQPERGSV